MTKPKSHKNENDRITEDIIFLFKDINEGVQKLYGNRTERKWALHLHSKYGEKVRDMVAFVPTYNRGLKATPTGRVFGKITKPSHMVEHLEDFFEAKRRFNRQIDYELKKEEIDRKDREDAERLQKERDAYSVEEKERMRKQRNEDMQRIIRGF